MVSLFIADLHLKVCDSPEPYLNFIRFLKYVEDKCDNLYILGDFFSYWYEHAGIDIYSKNPALKALRDFKKKGKKIFFLRGNRDFAAGQFFKKYSCSDYMGDDYIINYGDEKIFLTHGDKFAKKDIRYYIWRKFIRSSISLYIFRHLPVGYAINLVDIFKNVGKNRSMRNKIIAGIMLTEAAQ